MKGDMMLILVPVVLTPEGEAAIEYAVAEARLHMGTILLMGHAEASQQTGNEVERLRALLEELETRLVSDGIQCETRWSAGASSLDHVVLNTARESEVDLIVMGLRRRSRVGKMLLGSYEQGVLLGAGCPVVAVKADRTANRGTNSD
jgi:nucleotide-binding universal stress UspA family protein